SIGKVEGRDGTAEIVGQGGSGRPIGHTLDAVAFPALDAGEYITSGLDAIRRDFGLGRDLDGRSRLLVRPTRREVLNPGHKVGALLLGQRVPLRHVGAVQAPSDGVEKILIGRQSSGRSGAALEDTQLEVAGLLVNGGLHVRGVFAVPITQGAVTADAVPAVGEGGIFGVAGNISDVAFRANTRCYVECRELR